MSRLASEQAEQILTDALSQSLTALLGTDTLLTATDETAPDTQVLWLRQSIDVASRPQYFVGIEVNTLARLLGLASGDGEAVSQQSLADDLMSALLPKIADLTNRPFVSTGVSKAHPNSSMRSRVLSTILPDEGPALFHVAWNRAFESELSLVQDEESEAPASMWAEGPGEVADLGVLKGVELPVTFNFGTTEMSLEEALALNLGSIIELKQPLAEPIRLMVNGKSLARGQLVVVEGKYAVRITEVMGSKN